MATISNEHQPLLTSSLRRYLERESSTAPRTERAFETVGGQNFHEADVHTWAEFELLKSILSDSVPVILSYILQNSIQTVSVVIAGRLGAHELSVAAFSVMLAFVSGESSSRFLIDLTFDPTLGGTTALDTLGSQAFTGSSRPTDLSVHLQRCILMLWLLIGPVCIAWAFVEPVLIVLGQPFDLAADTQRFLRLLIFGAPGYIGFESLKKYLQCQGIMGLSTIVLLITSPFNVLFNIILIHYSPLRLFGAPVAMSMTYWLAFLLLAFSTYISPKHRSNGTWGGINLIRVLHPPSCLTFLQLALPGILMVGTEWAAFEIVALCAGNLGALPLAAQSVIMTFDQILNTLPFGIGVAASNRVGNLIGAKSAGKARRAAHASALLSILVGVVVMTLLLVFKDVCGYVLSDDDEVVSLVSNVMPLVASFQISDGLAGSCGGVLRGQGRQHLGAIFNFVAYYVIALPLGITLAFNGNIRMGLQGLWIGQVVGLTVVGVGEYLSVWLGTDWDREVEKGAARNMSEERVRQAIDTSTA
ncbi:ethionine resistance protein [Marasmius crinis-equi]|uniref:Ethionine resistance protein n=1 Tax=Marasmius crinis-equi TaxID=585013 RepID=A0ABR3FP64_9AGAR